MTAAHQAGLSADAFNQQALTAAMETTRRMVRRSRDRRTRLSRMSPAGQAGWIAAAAIYAYQQAEGGPLPAVWKEWGP